jgi:tetratricopeptide (TPR) repeat protein
METVKNPLAEFLRKAYDYMLRYKKECLIGAVVVIGLIILVIGYGYYKEGVQRRAHKDLVRALKYFTMPIRTDAKQEEIQQVGRKFFISGKEKWTEVERVFDDAYQKNKGAGIAPLFLVYKSEALLHLGKREKAIEVLSNAVGYMSKGFASRSYYEIKLALMEIDSDNKAFQMQGLQNLKSIALDQDNYAQDMGLYRLGEYFWYKKKFSEAKNYWNQLLLKYGKKTKKPSWWTTLAKEKLRFIA